jgi:tetratricopeptide (TPR) repeat protein
VVSRSFVPLFRSASAALALAGAAVAAAGAPYVPASDSEVVERLALRASDQAARELSALRAAWRRNPDDASAAVRLAAAYIDQAGAEGDPRYVGYAQSALQPWWREPNPPPPVRVMRALVLQYDHRFDDALADLGAAVQAQPDDAQAWAWITAIHLVRVDIERARQSCDRLAELAPELVGAACHAQIDALTGHATQAATALRTALLADPGADPALRLWVLTRLAETEERRGDVAAAERAYRDALTLRVSDVYLLAAYADFLLDNGRAVEVLTLLKDHARADVLLLRLAIAAKATQDPKRDALARELAARFDAARARGDTSHRKEESRFALALQGQADRALALARANYEQQRELADARIVLEAALAARQRAAAQPVLSWMEVSGIESPALRSLAAKLRELP